MSSPSFPKLVVVCDFCKKSFDLPDKQYQGYYNGQMSFYCDNNCKFEHTKQKAVERIDKNYVKLTRDEKKALKFDNMIRRVNELTQFRIDNAETIKTELKDVRKVCKHDDTRSDEMIKLRLAGESLQQIGDKFGITKERVRQLLKKRGCTFKPKKPKKPPLMYDLTCVECGKNYQRTHKSKYCSYECRSAKSISSRNKFQKLVCVGCGCEFERSDYLINIARHGKTKRGYDVNTVYCTHDCYFKNGNIGRSKKRRVVD